MKKYQVTDFHYWEMPLREQLKAEGKFIYYLRDCGKTSTIEKWVLVDKIGYLITTEELPLKDYDGVMAFEELERLRFEEDCNLKQPQKDMTDILAKSKEEYVSQEGERKKTWENIINDQELRLERQRHYDLFNKFIFPLPNGYKIVIQSVDVYDKEKAKQEVLFFIRDTNDKIIKNSTKEIFNWNEKMSNMIEQIVHKYLA